MSRNISHFIWTAQSLVHPAASWGTEQVKVVTLTFGSGIWAHSDHEHCLGADLSESAWINPQGSINTGFFNLATSSADFCGLLYLWLTLAYLLIYLNFYKDNYLVWVLSPPLFQKIHHNLPSWKNVTNLNTCDLRFLFWEDKSMFCLKSKCGHVCEIIKRRDSHKDSHKSFFLCFTFCFSCFFPPWDDLTQKYHELITGKKTPALESPDKVSRPQELQRTSL